MKYVFCLCYLAILTACDHPASDHYTISGNIKGLPDSLIYLQHRVGDSAVRDPAVVKAGKFQFTGEVPMPALVNITTKEGHIPFYLENADIHVEGNADSLDNVRITGSATQATEDSLMASMQPITDQIHAMYDAYDAADKTKDPVKLAIAQTKLDSLNGLQHRATLAFIRTHPASPISLHLLQAMTYSGSYPELEGLFEGLDTVLRSSAMGEDLSKSLAIMKRLEVGDRIMDFTQNDLQGRPVRFADFRKGRYVLLDFWASWCGPCREENPNVLKAYNRFKTKNFVVLGVSLDDDGAKWRRAVAKDGMPWTQVSDLKGPKNEVSQQYAIQGIPANFLVDTSGTIIAKNLRGSALEKKLSEVLQFQQHSPKRCVLSSRR